MTLNWEIKYYDHRCFTCGKFYSVEQKYDDIQECPYCAYGARVRLRRQRDRAERAAAGMKGVITKLKKELGK